MLTNCGRLAGKPTDLTILCGDDGLTVPVCMDERAKGIVSVASKPWGSPSDREPHAEPRSKGVLGPMPRRSSAPYFDLLTDLVFLEGNP